MEHPIIISSNGKVFKGKAGQIARLLSSPSGRLQLAKSMVAPLRTTLDYQSIGRKVFMVAQLPSGALPIYDKDPAPTGIAARRVTIPEFEIYSNPSVKISDVRQRRFNIIDRFGNQKTINRSGYKSIKIW